MHFKMVFAGYRLPRKPTSVPKVGYKQPISQIVKNRRIMCILCTPWRIYQLTYRSTLDRCISRYIGRVSTDMSVDISTNSWPIRRPRYVGRRINQCIDRDIGRVMVNISLTVGRYLRQYRGRHSANKLTIDCRRNIGWLLLVYWAKA